jgi:SAM-dependent methyltransferase
MVIKRRDVSDGLFLSEAKNWREKRRRPVETEPKRYGKNKGLWMEDDPKIYFRDTYMPDSTIRKMNRDLASFVASLRFVRGRDSGFSALEFGCGTGKNLILLQDERQGRPVWDPKLYGVDINPRALDEARKNGCNATLWAGDEMKLRELANSGFQVDVSFTCGCLDHVRGRMMPILADLKRISRTAVILYETNDVVGRYYYGHAYQLHGFKRKKWFDYHSATSQGGDGAHYSLWLWERERTEVEE